VSKSFRGDHPPPVGGVDNSLEKSKVTVQVSSAIPDLLLIQ